VARIQDGVTLDAVEALLVPVLLLRRTPLGIKDLKNNRNKFLLGGEY